MWKIAIAIFVFPDAESPAHFSFFGERFPNVLVTKSFSWKLGHDTSLYLEPKLWLKKQKLVKFQLPQKVTMGIF